MFIEAAFLGIVAGLVGRGKMSNFLKIKLTLIWFGVAALIIQLGITFLYVQGIWPVDDKMMILRIISYILLFVFLWANKYLPGCLLFGAGFLLNFADTIMAAGVIPFRLTWLGEVITNPWPQGQSFSIGDLLISLGIFWLIFKIMTQVPASSKLTSVRSMKL